jgi:hypothetical protein
MRIRLPQGASTIMLAGITACLLLGVAASLWRGTQVRKLLATPASQVDAPQPLPEVKPSASSLASIQDHALFYRSRTYHSPIAPVEAPPAPPPAYQLTGVITIPDKPSVAVLKSRTDGSSRSVRPGEDLDGWHVQSVEQGTVVLMLGAQRAELVSDTAKASSAAVAIAPSAGSAPRTLGSANTAAGAALRPPPRLQTRLFRQPPGPTQR